MAERNSMHSKTTDFIDYLHKRSMSHISEKIFSFLDYQSLVSASTASPLWARVISKGNLWQKLHHRNMAAMPDWRRVGTVVELSPHFCTIMGNLSNSQSYYQEVCQKTGDCLQQLHKRWMFGRAHTGYTSNPVPSERFQKNPSFDMNQQWVAQSQPNGTIEIWERWSRQLYHVFNFELEEAAEGDYRHREFREPECVQLSDQLLVAGFVFGHVCVWSIASKKLLHILYDNPLVAGHIIEESSLAAEYVRLSEDGSLFLTCLTSCDQDYGLLTLRRVKNHTEFSFCAHVLLEPVRTIYDVSLDESRVVLSCLVDEGDVRCGYELQIRSSVDLSLLHSIVDVMDPCGMNPSMDFRCGVIAVALNHCLSFWDVKSAKCVRTIPLGKHDKCLRSIRFVSERYIVSCHNDGQLNVWDAKAAVENPEADADSIFLRSFQLKICKSHRSRFMLMRGDEFQLAVEVQVGVYIHRCTLDCVKRATFLLDFTDEEGSDDDSDSSSSSDDSESVDY